MNKHKINNHINTFYNQKEQQSAKKRNITDEMEHSQTYWLRVRDDELTIETGRRMRVVMDRSESSNGDKLFVSTL